MTVKAGHCYIDRHCYADGEFSYYAGTQCMKCDASTPASRQEWSAPDTTNHCFIDGKCYDKDAHKPEGYSESECETCQPSMLATDFTMLPGYQMVDGDCQKMTWAEEAKAAGWHEPCPQNSLARRSRKLAARRSRKLAQLENSDDDDEL